MQQWKKILFLVGCLCFIIGAIQIMINALYLWNGTPAGADIWITGDSWEQDSSKLWFVIQWSEEKSTYYQVNRDGSNLHSIPSPATNELWWDNPPARPPQAEALTNVHSAALSPDGSRMALVFRYLSDINKSLDDELEERGSYSSNDLKWELHIVDSTTLHPIVKISIKDAIRNTKVFGIKTAQHEVLAFFFLIVACFLWLPWFVAKRRMMLILIPGVMLLCSCYGLGSLVFFLNKLFKALS